MSTWRDALPIHPAANAFPMMPPPELVELGQDIAANGLQAPLVAVTVEGKRFLLDGRNRLAALATAGRIAVAGDGTISAHLDSGKILPVEVSYVEVDDPVAYVVSLNLRRRHMDASQRALAAARLATLKDGQRADLVEGVPIGTASNLLNVSDRSVKRARAIVEHGVPELQQAVEHGEVSVAAAADVAMLSAEEQHGILDRGWKHVVAAAKAVREPKEATPVPDAAITSIVDQLRSRPHSDRVAILRGVMARLRISPRHFDGKAA